MKPFRLVFPTALLALAACTPKPTPFDQLKIEPVEMGDLPASMVANVPAQEGVVVYTREKAGIVKAVYRKKIPCPSRMISSVSGLKAMPDRILLCFEPLEAVSPEAVPLSACPYDLAVSYEMWGVPESVEPKFEIVDSCKGF